MRKITKILGIKVGLMKQILMDGFSGIIHTGQVEDQKMMKDKLLGGKEP